MTSVISYLDNIDKKIVNLIQEDPDITYTEIAEKVGRSQPAIGKRIKKLEDGGILSYQAGSSIKNPNFIFVIIKIQTKNPKHILKLTKQCPYMLVGFRMMGNYNINIITYGSDLKFINNLINSHFRRLKDVISIKFDVIIDINENLVLPLDFNLFKCSCAQYH